MHFQLGLEHGLLLFQTSVLLLFTTKLPYRLESNACFQVCQLSLHNPASNAINQTSAFAYADPGHRFRAWQDPLLSWSTNINLYQILAPLSQNGELQVTKPDEPRNTYGAQAGLATILWPQEPQERIADLRANE